MKRAGSVTVWAALSLLLLLSLLFTCAEGICVMGKRTASRQALATASEGILAGYCIPLWETYGILAADPFYGRPKDTWTAEEAEAHLAQGVSKNLPPGFFSSGAESVTMKEVCLLGDDKGACLIAQGAACELAALGEEGIELLTGQASQPQYGVLSSEEIDAMLDAGTEALQQDAVEAQQSQSSAESADTSASGEGAENIISGITGNEGSGSVAEGMTEPAVPAQPQDVPRENPIEAIKKWKQNGVLSQVLPASDFPSDTVRADAGFSGRTLFRGTGTPDPPSLAQEAAFRGYLADRMSCYTAPKEGRRCALEAEYILCGKNSDRANLEAMVWRLIGLREVQNLAALASDPARMAQAEGIAVSLAAASANPAVIAAVQAAIVAAWAYLESVLDVRLLLSGGTVPLQKTPAEWSSDISAIAACLPVTVKARPAAGAGLDYHGALLLLFGLENKGKMVRRTLETMEYQIRGNEACRSFRIDGLICGFTSEAVFSSQPVFPSAVLQMPEVTELYAWTVSQTTAYQ